MLKLNGLSKAFGGLHAVDNVTIDFEPGKITSLIGPNGAGKTTIFNLISGFLKPDHGEILLEVKRQKLEDINKNRETQDEHKMNIDLKGQRLEARNKKQAAGTQKSDEFRIHTMKPYEIARLGIGRLFQDVRVFKKMSCLDNIIVGTRYIYGENPINALFAPRFTAMKERQFKERAAESLAYVGLQDKQRSLAEDLSFGEQKLLSIARLMNADYDILLLDEPAAGVNPIMIEKIMDLIKKLAAMGKIIIVIEHNMNVVYRISDFVYFMNEGSITAFGKPDDVFGNDEVRRIYIGL